MKSSKDIQAEIDALQPDDNDWRYWKLEGQLNRAILSEEFREVALPTLKAKTNQCEEKADESFFITLQDGKRFVYYSSKGRLVPIYAKGKKGRGVKVPPLRLLAYFFGPMVSNDND